MSKEIVIVTAFFDIKRENFEVYNRSSNEYIEYFKFWARIKNEVIIYCQKEYYDEISKIRKDFHLEHKTNIIIIDNIFEKEPKLYNDMVAVSNNEKFKEIRYHNISCENKADYDYIMLMKYWCVADAAKRVDRDVNFAWVDFGFNHGGSLYTNPIDFDFTWEYDFGDKINIFCLTHPDEELSVEALLIQNVCIMGAPLVIPKQLAEQLYIYIYNAMVSLISLDCIDDDQQLLLMVYKLHKELFNVIISDWFDAFIICSDHNFSTVNESNERNSIDKNKLKGTLKSVLKKLTPVYFSLFIGVSSKTKNYLKRIYNICIDHYR